MSQNPFFLLATLLFSIGLIGLISRRNLFVVYMSIELMLSFINLILATLSKLLGDGGGSVMALLLIAIIAAEAALFLAIIVHLYRQKKTLDSNQFRSLSKEK